MRNNSTPNIFVVCAVLETEYYFLVIQVLSFLGCHKGPRAQVSFCHLSFVCGLWSDVILFDTD